MCQRRVDTLVAHQRLPNGGQHAPRPGKSERAAQVVSGRGLPGRRVGDNARRCGQLQIFRQGSRVAELDRLAIGGDAPHVLSVWTLVTVPRSMYQTQ